ncbi:MAG: pentapeptide repeat-containing protein [Desulfobacterales bacterium]
MADNNQIAILSQGVEIWNKWREENPDVLIDLNNARLMHMNLKNANLAEADLERANLGFGDIIPKTTTAAMCVTVEVILGYVMLGGLITIFASKLSRRGG